MAAGTWESSLGLRGVEQKFLGAVVKLAGEDLLSEKPIGLKGSSRTQLDLWVE